jgi:hypothetical protein
MTLAPERFATWMSGHTANDKKHGRKVFRYQPRSDEHSKMLCRMVLDDLLLVCPPMAAHVRTGQVVGLVNARHTFANGKTKNLDLAIGTPNTQPGVNNPINQLRVSIEAKQCMTEHSKTKPRLFDELSSSHQIVHFGDPAAIAAGIVVVNFAEKFASPLIQKTKRGPLIYKPHKQPGVTESMVRHLRGLQRRTQPTEVGFDAFATIIVSCDNVGPCIAVSSPPAPQPDELDHYETFLRQITAAYALRYGE